MVHARWHRMRAPLAVVLILLATGPRSARADDTAPGPDDGVATDVAADGSRLSEWWTNEPLRFAANVYGWAPNIPVEYDLGPAAGSLPIRLPTLLDSLQGAAMLDFQVRKGRFGAYVAPIVMFLRYSTHRQGLLRRHRISVKDYAYLTDFGLSYELGRWKLGEHSASPTVSVEPFVGYRWLIDDFEIDIDPGPTFKPDIDFITPIVGLRTFWDLTERWHLRIEGDYGGWDVDDVKRTWNALGVVGYRFKMGDTTTHVFAGYRYLHAKYEKTIKLRASVRGPLAGIGWEF